MSPLAIIALVICGMALAGIVGAALADIAADLHDRHINRIRRLYTRKDLRK